MMVGQAYVGLGTVGEISRGRFEPRAQWRETWVRESIPGRGNSTHKGPEKKQFSTLQGQKYYHLAKL